MIRKQRSNEVRLAGAASPRSRRRAWGNDDSLDHIGSSDRRAGRSRSVYTRPSNSRWRSLIAAWLGAPDRGPEAKLPLEDWPICTTMAAMGSEADWAQLDPDFAAGKKALVAEDWNGAIAALKLAALRDPRNADIQNYIGYAYRRLRQLGPAMQHYQQALRAQSPPPQRPRAPR